VLLTGAEPCGVDCFLIAAGVADSFVIGLYVRVHRLAGCMN